MAKKVNFKKKETFITTFYYVPADAVDTILGEADALIAGINACHGWEGVNLYRFNRTTLKKNSRLRSYLFGRENAQGRFVGSEAVANGLATEFSKYVIAETTVQELDNMMTAEKGHGLEEWLKAQGYLGTTLKEDKELKQDLKKGRYTYQVKCSVACERTNWSYATTNGTIEL